MEPTQNAKRRGRRYLGLCCSALLYYRAGRVKNRIYHCPVRSAVTSVYLYGLLPVVLPTIHRSVPQADEPVLLRIYTPAATASKQNIWDASMVIGNIHFSVDRSDYLYQRSTLALRNGLLSPGGWLLIASFCSRAIGGNRRQDRRGQASPIKRLTG